MAIVEPTEVNLDKPRKILINHLCLANVEAEVNRLRFAKPEDYTDIHVMIVDAGRRLTRSFGMFPMDLMLSLLTHGLVYGPKERRFTREEIAGLLDLPQVNPQDVSVALWNAYFNIGGRFLKTVENSEPEKKTDGLDQPTGSGSGRSEELN